MVKLWCEIHLLGYYFLGLGIIGVIITGFKEVAFMQLAVIGILQTTLAWTKTKE